MDPNLRLVKTDENILSDPTSYRRLNRPDLAFSVTNLSQFMDNKVLHYVNNIAGQGVFFCTKAVLHLKGFLDSNWAMCLDTRKISYSALYVSWRLIYLLKI